MLMYVYMYEYVFICIHMYAYVVPSSTPRHSELSKACFHRLKYSASFVIDMCHPIIQCLVTFSDVPNTLFPTKHVDAIFFIRAMKSSGI